jgi:hypothetical protein
MARQVREVPDHDDGLINTDGFRGWRKFDTKFGEA